VYVKRDDAALISDRAAQPRAENTELKWKEVELQIREAILKRGVPDITVTFIGDTAYLRGTVQSPQEAELAELGAKTIPEVKYVHNGIWVSR
jgi:osmotically-inducible protein OsmY